jgi:hypothetical protein
MTPTVAIQIRRPNLSLLITYSDSVYIVCIVVCYLMGQSGCVIVPHVGTVLTKRTPSLDDLLCSYYLKTILFWMFEEIDECKWSPDNFINCYMACIQRLLYCVEFSTVVHYFMPDNNMLEDKLTSRDKTKLTNLLRDLFKSGWSCFLKT